MSLGAAAPSCPYKFQDETGASSWYPSQPPLGLIVQSLRSLTPEPERLPLYRPHTLPMSDVAVPSFFPTPTEIAGGLRWVKQHPVVATAAAAAATAVSVLTYLKAAAEDERALQVAILSPRKAHEGDDLCSSTESDASTPTRDRTLSPRNLSFGELDAEAEAVNETDESVENSELEAALSQADGDTVSPQWGWYVSTTPPEEYYQ